MAGKMDHDMSALRDHCQTVSGSLQEVSDDVLSHVPAGTVAHWLGNTPSPDEVRLAVRKLRDCSPGRDEITAGMLRWAGPRAMDCVISIIQSLWVSHPDIWPTSIKQGVGVYLHKKGDRHDLGNYRIIMLLPIISRVLARIVAARLQQWSESETFLHNFQWGFRPNRRCTDPALVLTLLLEMANAHKRAQDDAWDPLVLVLWDIVKAYPSTQRHLCWKLFHKLGVPDQLLRVLYGLHDCTDYVIRSGDEYSAPFSLASPICFSIFHNFAIGRFLQKQQQAGNVGIHCTVNPQAPFHLRKQLAGNPEQLDSLDFFALLFADDTTGLTRRSQLASFEEDMATCLRDFAEKLHPGKMHRLLAGQPPTAGGAFTDAVRFLGVWLQWDGKHDRDTYERLQAAQKLWHKLHAQLQRLGLDPKCKGRLIQATVVNCLLYGCERRTFSGKQMTKYQTFINRITFSICSQRRKTMSDDQVTLADLRKKCGLLPLRHIIESRQLHYLGHLARLDKDRIERQVLHATLWPEGEETGIKTGPTLRQQYWRLLKQLLGTEAQQWMDIAQQQDGILWRSKLSSWHQQWCDKESQFEWKNKHSAEGLAERRRKAAAARAEAATGAIRCPDGRYKCSHEGCEMVLSLRAMRLHVQSCAELSIEVRQRRARQKELRHHEPARGARVLRRPAAAAAEGIPHVAPAPAVPVFRRSRLWGKQPAPPDWPQDRATWPSTWMTSWAKYHRSALFLVKARVMTTTDLPCPKHGPTETRTTCVWCHLECSSTHKCIKHMRSCSSMSYDNWLYRIRFLQRQHTDTPHKCPHCGTYFSVAKSCGRHSVQCKKRRQLSSLALNTGLWHDIDNEQIRI